MLGIVSKKVAIIVLLAAIASFVIGGIFIFQGIDKSNAIVAAMSQEQVSYDAEEANGAINGIIDTPDEAQAMADVLRQHRTERYGRYTELGRDDPNRDTILKALTMENSLNLAQLGYGLTTVVKAIGTFMVIVGLALGASSVSVIRSRKQWHN